MKKRIIYSIVIIIALFVFMILITNQVLVLNGNTERILNIIIDKFNNINNLDQAQTILEILKVFFSFLVANLVGLTNLFFNVKKDVDNKKPNILIHEKGTTILRKDKNNDYTPYVELGKGNQFVYVSAEIKNTGNCIIQDMYINCINIHNDLFEEKEKTTVYFKINKYENSKFKDKYKSKIKIKAANYKNYYANIYIVKNKETDSFKVKCSKIKRG